MSASCALVEAIRPAVRELSFHPPGRSVEEVARAYGIPTDWIVRLGSNENPYGPSPRVAEALMREADRLNSYPAGLYAPLRARLAELNRVSEAETEIGPGAESIIRYLAMLFIGPGDELVIQRRSFDAAPWWTTVMGGVVRYVETKDYGHDLEAYAAAVGPRTRLLWITSPDNPSGMIVRHADVARLLERVPRRVAVVFDQAYREYVDDPEYADGLGFLRDGARNVIVLHTFSKAYGLAGVRLGYVLADASVCQALESVHEPFHVSRTAAVAGVAALDDPAWMRDAVTKTITERGRLAAALARLGHVVVPSQANFVLAHLPFETGNLTESLLRRGVIVRRPDKWGYGDHLRITVGKPEHTDRLLEELHELGA